MPTPVPGYGYYQRMYRPLGGTRTSVVGFGFRNTPGGVAAAVRPTLVTATSSGGSLFDQAELGVEWEFVGDYCLVSSAFGVLTSDGVSAVTAGTDNFDSLPANTSIVVHKNTDLAGRQFRGRMAVPGGFMAETFADAAGVIDNAVRVIHQVRAQVLFTNLVTASLPMFLLHGPNKLGVTPLPTQVTALEVDGTVGTQRRRMR